MVKEVFDYYTKRAGTAPFLMVTEKQSSNKWDWSGDQICAQDKDAHFFKCFRQVDGKFKSMDDFLSETSPGVEDFVHLFSIITRMIIHLQWGKLHGLQPMTQVIRS